MKRSRLKRKTPLNTRAARKRYEDKLRAEGASRFRSLGRNRERSRKRRERDFGPKAEWIRTLRCCACGAAPPSDPHHVKSRGAGGTAKDLLPICRPCHDFGHTQGWQTFAEIFEIDLKAEAERLEEEWTS